MVYGSEGNDWKEKKKLLSKIFTYDFIIDSIPRMANIADEVLDNFENKYWLKHPQQKQTRKFEMNVLQMIRKFTSSITVTQFLGVQSLKNQHPQLQNQPIADSILKMVNLVVNNYVSDPFVMFFGKNIINKGWRKCDREYLQIRNNVRSVLTELILKEQSSENNANRQNEDHQNQKKKKTLVKLLFEEKKKGNQTFEINTDYIIDQLITFVFAGTDTTSSFLSSMILLIFEKPHVTQKLREQINAVIKSDSDITVQNFKKIPYLDCIINETSRMISSILNFFTRIATKDSTLGDIMIKKGTLIECTWLNVFYNEKLFENPMDFNPDRWYNEECSRHANLVSIIFSGGPRSCIGRSLALTNIKVMIIKFMQRYQNLIEIHREQRQFEFSVSYGIKNTESVITKAKK